MGNNECNMDYKITYSEAIERLKYMKIKAEVALSTTKCTCSWAKESVKGTIMALDMAINALEKQIPKKPRKSDSYIGVLKRVYAYVCPTCGNACLEKYMNERQNTMFCWNCGQKLDWSDEE